MAVTLPLPRLLPKPTRLNPSAPSALVAVEHRWVNLAPYLPAKLPLGSMCEPLLVSHHTLAWPNLPKACQGLTLAHLTDAHLSWPTLPWLKGVSQWLATQPYHALALTGDVITKGDTYLPELRAWLQSLPQGKPTLASMGNHDYEDGDHGRHIKTLYRDLGIGLLVNDTLGLTLQGIVQQPELATLTDALCVMGLDDALKGKPDVAHLQAQLAQRPQEAPPAILLCHNPYLLEQSPHWPGVGLILAGHTHGGQFAPWPVPMAWVTGSNYLEGLYTLPTQNQGLAPLLHVNQGIGTACLDIAGRTFPLPRLLVRPQVSFWTLV